MFLVLQIGNKNICVEQDFLQEAGTGHYRWSPACGYLIFYSSIKTGDNLLIPAQIVCLNIEEQSTCTNVEKETAENP